ncbi:DnaJ domain protein [Aspergillus sp. HF37]|nr:DnaJ domain protein [Aspergillus sp. HF37]
MAKTDVRRDYYADLGLVPSADTDDIKKQFRKLALKFHPDRNPGKEVEYNSKFQAIQAAYEILVDPTQRLKYDTDRIRAGYGKFYTPSGSHNIPRKPSAANYTPASSTAKPQRKSPFANRPNSFQNTAGAQRYASYSRGAPQQPGQRAQDRGQTRADAYRGFQNTKGSGSGMPGWSQFDPRTGGRSPYSGSMPRANDGQSQKQRSAYEHFNASHSASNENFNAQAPKKKQGFAPRTPGGDEPMASNTSAYANTARDRSNRWSTFFESAPSPTARKQTAASQNPPTQTDKDGRFAERESSRYATSGGEKTFFSSGSFAQSAGMRVPPQQPRPAWEANAPGTDSPNTGQHRSASPNGKADSPQSSDTSTSSSDTEDGDERSAFEPKAPKSRLRAREKYANYRARYNMNAGTGEHSATQSSNTGSSYFPPRILDSLDNLIAFTRKKIGLDADQDVDGLKEGHNSDSAPFSGGAQRPQSQPTAPQAESNVTENPDPASEPQNGSFKSSSHGDLRSGFKANDWHSAFQGDFVFQTTQPDKNQTPNPQTADTSGGAGVNGLANTPPGRTSNGPSRSAPVFQRRPVPSTERQFSAEGWMAQFSNLSWAMPKDDGTRDTNSQASRASSQGPRSPKKQSKPASRAQAQPAQFTEKNFNPDDWAEQFRNMSWLCRMKMAPETPIPKHRRRILRDRGALRNSQSLQPGLERRTQPVEDQAAKVDVEEGEAMDIDEDQSTAAAGPEKEPRNQNKDAPQPKPGTSPNSGKVKDPQPESGAFNMNNLGKTDPFTNTNSGGIDNMKDIHATLPFESCTKPAGKPVLGVRARELQCPNPPKRPRVPNLMPVSAGSQQLGLSRSVWNRYVAEMNTYMREWNDFNGRMLAHFLARQEAVKTGLAPGWIGAVGDSARLNVDSPEGSEPSRDDTEDAVDDVLMPGTAKGGYSAYLRGLEEDVKVRKHWDVACEMHHECILHLGKMREWIRNGGKLL